MVAIEFQEGLHMRPAGALVAACRPFDADSVMRFKGNNINLKSVLGVVGAQVRYGDVVEIACDGPEANEALAALLSVLSPK